MDKNVVVKIDIPFPTNRHADIAYQVMRVDAEPKRSEVKKILQVDENILKVEFTAEESRKIRVAVTSFFESIHLVTNALAEYPEIKPKYDYYE